MDGGNQWDIADADDNTKKYYGKNIQKCKKPPQISVTKILVVSP